MGKEDFIKKYPPSEQFDPEATWSSICLLFIKSVESLDLGEISNSLRQLEFYIETGQIKATSERSEKIIVPLFDFTITLPFIDVPLQLKASRFFVKLSAKYITRPHNVHLSLQKVLNFQKEIFMQPTRLMKPPPKEATEFIKFTSIVHLYFDENDGKYLISENLDKIGLLETTSFKASLELLRFFPTKCLPMIVNNLVPFLTNPLSPLITNAIFYYFSAAVVEDNVVYDWTPHIRPIFNAIASVLNPGVKILGDHFHFDSDLSYQIPLASSGGFDRDNIITYTPSFISGIIIDGKVGQTTLKNLEEFLSAFIPMITPRSKKAGKIISLVSNLIFNLHQRIRAIQTLKKYHSLTDLPEVSQETRDEFVRVIMPFVIAALFRSSNASQKIMLKYINVLAEISYELTVHELVQFCQDNMIDPEMSATSRVCLKLIHRLIPVLFCEERIDENMERIPVIIDAALECIRSAANERFRSGMSLLSSLTRYISVPSESEIDQMPIKRRMVANALKNSLNVVINGFSEHIKPETNKPDSDEGQEQEQENNSNKEGKNTILISYFAAFDDSIIEKEVFPLLLQKFRGDSNSEYSSILVSLIAQAKPSLTTRVFVPTIIERLEKARDAKIEFYSRILGSAFLACPEFSEKVPQITELVLKYLKYEKDDEDENKANKKESESNLNVAAKLLKSIYYQLSFYQIIDYSNTEECDKGKWGKTYLYSEINPKWFKVDKSVTNNFLDQVLTAIQPHLAKFTTATLSKQKLISKVVSNIILFITNRGKFGRLDFYEYNSAKNKDDAILEKVENTILDFIENSLKTLTNANSLVLVLSMLRMATYSELDTFKRYKFGGKLVSSFRRQRGSCDSSRTTRLSLAMQLQRNLEMSNFFYSYRPTDRINKLFDVVYPLLYSEYSSIYKAAGTFLNFFTFASRRIQTEFVEKQLELLENPEITELQCKGALRYLNSLLFIYVVKSPERYFARMIRAIVSLKFDKSWKINIQLNGLLNKIEQFRPTLTIPDGLKEWQRLLDDVTKLPRTIDGHMFLFIIRFLVFQLSPPSESILRFIVSSATCTTDANRLITLQCLTNLLCRMKPIAPRSRYADSDQFVAKHKNDNGLLPFVDKSSIGTFCKADHFIFYDGPSVFPNDDNSSNDNLSKARIFLAEKLLNNEETISELFDSIALLHPEGQQIVFNPNFMILWKGIGQILKGRFTDLIKKKIQESINPTNNNVAKNENASNGEGSVERSTAVQVVTACEAISGLSRATKHWCEEDRRKAIDDVLVPSVEHLLHTQANETLPAIIQMTVRIVGDWDFRRVLWFYHLIERLLRETSDSILRNVLQIAQIAFSEANVFFNVEFTRIMRESLMSKFHDLTLFKLDDIASYAHMFTCRLLSLPRFPGLISSKTNSNENTGLPSNLISDWPLLPFDVFDANRVEHPELVALIFSEIFSDEMHFFSAFLPQLAARFKEICAIDGSLANITSGKYLHYGKNILTKIGFLEWHCHPELLDSVLNDVLSVRDSLPWNSRLNLVGFLHTLTFSHIFLFEKEKEFKTLLEKVLPPFIADENLEVRTAAILLLKTLVSVVYTGKWEECVKQVLTKLGDQKERQIGVSLACALIANTSIWLSCPQWLPDLFGELEQIYNKGGNGKEEIKNTMLDFWKRHQGREIAEIEEFRYAFSGGYYT